MRKRVLAAVAAVILVGCSGGGSGPSEAEDQRTAEAALLVTADVQSSFSDKASSSSSSSSSNGATEQEFDRCLGRIVGVTAADFEMDRTANAKRTLQHEATELEAQVEMYRDAKTVQRQIEVIKQDAATQCLVEAIRATSNEARFTVRSVTPLPRPTPPTIGDRQSAVALRFIISDPKRTISGIIAFYVVQKGRALVSLKYTTAAQSPDRPKAPDEGVVSTALQAMTSRLK
jgi:hypothetical protein